MFDRTARQDEESVEERGMFDPMWSCILQDYEETYYEAWNPCTGIQGPYDRFLGWREARIHARERRKEQRRQRELEKQQSSRRSFSFF